MWRRADSRLSRCCSPVSSEFLPREGGSVKSRLGEGAPEPCPRNQSGGERSAGEPGRSGTDARRSAVRAAVLRDGAAHTRRKRAGALLRGLYRAERGRHCARANGIRPRLHRYRRPECPAKVRRRMARRLPGTAWNGATNWAPSLRPLEPRARLTRCSIAIIRWIAFCR